MNKFIATSLVLVLCLLAPVSAEARRKNKTRRRTGPPPTHPMVLWARTLNESTDRAQRRVAAYKLSQYSVNIVSQQVVDAVIKCSEDPDVEIKILCTKALAHSGSNASQDAIRKVLLDRYKKDPVLKDTVVRAFIARKDNSSAVQDVFVEELKKEPSLDHKLILLTYFEQFGVGNSGLMDKLVEQFQKDENIRLRRAIAKVLAARAQGQDSVVGLFAQCSESKDTPLALTCLDGLKLQGKKDTRVWGAAEKAIQSSDTDMTVATLDLINSLPETPNANISARLIEIMKDTEDPDIQEKAALALGVAGDHSEAIVSTLLKYIDDKETDDSVRIASVLVLGRQAVMISEQTATMLEKCVKENNSQALKTACGLATNELNQRKKTAADKKPAALDSTATPAPKQAQETPDSTDGEKTVTN